MDSTVSPKKEEVNYAFVYIAHPRAVTGFSWRQTSKYMPKYDTVFSSLLSYVPK